MKPEDAVSIRPLMREDTGSLYRAVMESRAELGRWMPWCHADYSEADSRSFVESQLAAFPAGTEYAFAIVDAAGTFLGCCGLNHFDRLNRLANLGYWVRTSRTGRGIAREASRQLVLWALANTDFNRIEVLAAVGNLGSQRVAVHIGGVREGVLRGRLRLGGVQHDAVVFSIVRGPTIPLAGAAAAG
jgi:RimJ/RimL family protein N-acetyltransferase